MSALPTHDETPLLLVCRGGTCGTEDADAQFDHRGQWRSFVGAAQDGGVRVVRTDCLRSCKRANMVVLSAGGRTTWFGWLLKEKHTLALCDVVAGRTRALSPGLERRLFSPGRKHLKALTDALHGMRP